MKVRVVGTGTFDAGEYRSVAHALARSRVKDCDGQMVLVRSLRGDDTVVNGETMRRDAPRKIVYECIRPKETS